MAHKLICPKCSVVLKEEGGGSKDEYRVYDNVWNPALPATSRRLIECLVCGYIANIEEDWGN